MLLLCSCPKPAPGATIRSRWSKWWGTTSTTTLKRTSSVRSNGGTKWTKTPGGRLHWRVTGASCPDLFFCLAYNPSSVSSPRKAHPTQSPINFQHPGFFTRHSHLYLLIFSNRILSRWATWFPSLFKHCDNYDSSEIISVSISLFLSANNSRHSSTFHSAISFGRHSLRIFFWFFVILLLLSCRYSFSISWNSDFRGGGGQHLSRFWHQSIIETSTCIPIVFVFRLISSRDLINYPSKYFYGITSMIR